MRSITRGGEQSGRRVNLNIEECKPKLGFADFSYMHRIKIVTSRGNGEYVLKITICALKHAQHT